MSHDSVQLTRELRVRLPVGPADLARPSLNTWAGWPRADLLTPLITVRLTVRGPVDVQTGYVADVKVLDDVLSYACVAVFSSDRNSGDSQTQLPRRLLEECEDRPR